MQILKQYCYLRQCKAYSARRYQVKLLQAAFGPLKRKQQLKVVCKTLLDKQDEDVRSRVFQALLDFAIKEQTLRERLEGCTRRKSQLLKAKVFKVLVCPEFYMSKEPLQLEECEKFKVRRAFAGWRGQAARARRMAGLRTQVEDKVKERLCRSFLWTWRSELYLEQAARVRSMPFFESTVEKNMKANVFHSLKWYAEHRLEKAQRMHTALHFYDDSLASRVVGTLRLHANFKIQSRLGIQVLSVKRSK